MPANDNCAGSIPTITATSSQAFSLCGATNDWTSACGGSGPDVLYRLTLATRSNVTIATTGAGGGFDPVLHLHAGPGCLGGELICNDDYSGLNSQISGTYDAGTYFIVVDSLAASTPGAGTLNVTIVPANDTCATATPITLNSGRTTVTGTTLGAGNDDACGNGLDVWYSFTLTQTEIVYINTHGSGYDTKLAFRSGSCAGATSGCTDDSCSSAQSELVATLAAGTYYLLVDSYYSGAGGDFTLNIEHLPTGSDGLARYLPVGSSTQSGTTSGASAVTGSCSSTGSAPEHLYYWTQCPSGVGGSFTGNTCGIAWDTVLYVRSGQTGADLTGACDDDGCGYPASSVAATIPAGMGLFGYYVDGYYTYSGAYSSPVVRP
jgi:hypothetical protein